MKIWQAFLLLVALCTSLQLLGQTEPFTWQYFIWLGVSIVFLMPVWRALTATRVTPEVRNQKYHG